MACTICGEEDVVLKIQHIANGEVKEIELCAQCAESVEIEHFGGDLSFNIEEFLQALFVPEDEGLDDGEDEEEDDFLCPGCGMSMEEFRARQRAGCPDCYYVFRKEAYQFLPQGYRYRGSVPRRFNTVKRILMDRMRLKRSLEHAIRNEDYERAARIRDRLRELEEDRAEQGS